MPASQYQVYGMSSPNVIKVIIMLEELEVDWSFEHVYVLKGEQFDPAFHALNPNGRVPVLVDLSGREQPFTVIESGAILQYLAEKHGGFIPADPLGRSTVIQWLTFQVASIGPMFGQYLHFSRFAGEGNDYAVARYTAEAVRIIRVVEERLKLTSFLGGETYSVADIAAYPWLAQVSSALVSSAETPFLTSWLEVVGSREKVRRALDIVQSIAPKDTASFAAATAADLDRFFNRVSATT